MGEGRTQIDSVEHSKHIFLLCVSRYATVILSDAFWRDSSDAEAGKTGTFNRALHVPATTFYPRPPVSRDRIFDLND